MLDNKVQREWARTGVVRLIDMSKDHYLVQFTSEEDYKHALFEGPWLIADHYIVVQRWKPFFMVTAKQTRKIAAWIRIPGLPIELFKDRFLWRVGNKLGTMLKIDKLTSIQSRGKFARICVEIDLQKKLVSQIDVLGYILKLEYEGLHSICFKSKDPTKTDKSSQTSDSAQQNGAEDIPSPEIQDSTDQYGPWMIVRRNKKQQRPRIAQLTGAEKNEENLPISNISSRNNLMLSGSGLPQNKEFDIQNINVEKDQSVPNKRVTTIRNMKGGKNPQQPKKREASNLKNVYGSPHSQFRIDLWRELRKLAANMVGSWSIMGDFNAVLHDHERQGGSQLASYRGDLSFREMVYDCNLVDMGFQGNPFKWKREMGDRNTKYFHSTTIIRKRKNRILKLKNDGGIWIENKKDLEELVTNFYKNLFEDPGVFTPFCLSGTFPELSSEDKKSLVDTFSDIEIMEAIQRMGGLKAPGPDGFQAIFYQTQWQTVGKSLCNLIRSIQEEPSKIAEINHTFITLIPKVDNVESIKQMRPISLCNVTTKSLATRLRKMMEGLVDPNQCSFVPHRQTTDNIIIAQEVIHSMRHKKGKKGWMAIKIDLEKEYDRLSWKFIKETFDDIGFPQRFTELVQYCYSTTSMQVLWNGEALESFKPSRGIRQGDPLSPYIFVYV
uniref:LINE-1 reverse transcriptase isogeny n=1 Tax=Cajanus cajan TaxID=3821 RepID=A0A151SDJ0_CAJCA|nr:LINE-1 reverse transcriptase isogeny [Cajanus cajan]